MSATTRSLGRRFLAAMGATALVGLGVFGATSAATAADPTQDASTPIVADQKGSITINKLQQIPGNSNGAGSGLELGADTDPAKPTTAALGGVKFTVKKVDVDLLTSEGAAKASGLRVVDGTVQDAGGAEVATSDLADATLEPTSGATSEDGVLKFSNLAVGVYLVAEQAPAAGEQVTAKVNGQTQTVPTSVVKLAEPFLVAVPTRVMVTEGEGTTPVAKWAYDVNVYPKNSVSQLTKTYDGAADPTKPVGPGSEVKWTITAEAPTLATGDNLTQFDVSDVMTASLQYVGIDSVKYGDTDLVADTDYTIEGPTANQDAGTTTVTVKLTAARLAEISKAENQGGKLTVVVRTKVAVTIDQLAASAGALKNAATSTIKINDNPPTTVTPQDPKNPDPNDPGSGVNYWGVINVKKVDGADANTVLAGAQFIVFDNEAAANAASQSLTAETVQKAILKDAGNPVTAQDDTLDKVIAKYAFAATNAQGTAQIGPLPVGTAADASKTYYLLEVKAPNGYIVDKTVQAVTVKAGTSTDADVNPEKAIKNNKTPQFNLPVTGATGTFLFAGVGGAVALFAIVLIVRNRKRSAAATL